MNGQPESNVPTAPAFVEDLFLTDAFLIKGRLPNKSKRLSSLLEDHNKVFLTIHDATMVSLRTGDVIRTPSVLVNTTEVIFAHELLEVAGDPGMRKLAQSNKSTRIRAFFNGPVQFELAGNVEPGGYEIKPTANRKYFIIESPVLRGLNLDNSELRVLRQLDYAIVRKEKMAYVYDFS